MGCVAHGECPTCGSRKPIELARRIVELEALVEAAYHEGFSHGESSASAYEWGCAADKHKQWEHSDAKEALATETVAIR